MGFDANGTRSLLMAKTTGASFDRVAMIGRQKMHLLPQTLKSLMDRFGYPAYPVIQARKVAEKAIFQNAPQQSDYSAHWHGARPD